jgi:leucyl aminopeptidase (aminopeptidase T)
LGHVEEDATCPRRAVERRPERLGGRPYILLRTDRLQRFVEQELSTAFYAPPPTALDSARILGADVRIELPMVSDPTIWASDRDSARLARLSATEPLWAPLDSASRARRVFLNVAQPSDTSGTGLTFEAYRRQVWDGITADYAQMARVGEALRQGLAGARRVRVTSPEGTDLTFTIGDRLIVLETGGVDTTGVLHPLTVDAPEAARTISLPHGTATVAPLEGSANGRIRAARDRCDELVRDEAIDVEAGVPTSVRAASDEACVQRLMKGQQFAAVVIGLNPGLRIQAFTNHSGAGAGVVQLVFGGNRMYGGTLDSQVQGSGGWWVPLFQATVTADGKVLVRDGRVVVPGAPPTAGRLRP